MHLYCPKKRFCSNWTPEHLAGCKHFLVMYRCGHFACLANSTAYKLKKELPAPMLIKVLA